MNKKLLKQLILISYKNGAMDNEIVSQITEKLDRNQLKQYIKALKNAEKLRNVYVESPFGMQKGIKEEFESIFPNKKVNFTNTPSLLVGTKITYNDNVFEMNLKNSLEQIIENIENYD